MASSVDSPEDLTKMRTSAGADFDFLSDKDGMLMDALGVRHENGGRGGTDIAQSASFLFSPNGELLWSKIAENFRVRPKPEEVLAAIDEHVPATR